MRKTMLILIAAAILVAVPAFGQTVIERHTFSTMSGWVPGPGNWTVSANRLRQNDGREVLARIDKRLAQQGIYQIDFNIRYIDGGYRSPRDWENGHFHAGFGVQLGVSNPPLRGASWGLGRSYLLWLNLDTRPETRRNRPEHYGFRAQVYESRSNIDMELMRSEEARALLGSALMSVDIMDALFQAFGYRMQLAELEQFLYRDVPISIRVNTRSGEIGVKDPTAPLRFFFTANPAVLRGDYIALRTNDLAASYSDFVVTSR